MIYLLDVNALVALGFINHEFMIVLLLGSNLKIHQTWRVAQSLSSGLYACLPKPRLTDLP
jgi:hypothetical protein